MFDDITDDHEEAFQRAVEQAAYEKHVGRAVPEFDYSRDMPPHGECANPACARPFVGFDHGSCCTAPCRNAWLAALRDEVA